MNKAAQVIAYCWGEKGKPEASKRTVEQSIYCLITSTNDLPPIATLDVGFAIIGNFGLGWKQVDKRTHRVVVICQ